MNESKLISTLIRIDESLYEDIKKEATLENRSINKQIEFILREYFDKTDVNSKIKNLETKIEELENKLK